MHRIPAAALPVVVPRSEGGGMGPSVVPLDSLPAKRVEEAGGKAANLGVLLAAGLPVPAGFVVTTSAFFLALEHAHIRKPIQNRFLSFDVNDPSSLHESAQWMQEEVRKMSIPMLVQDAILTAYHHMGENVTVAVRSSAVSEDRASASFAGMHETYTNVSGEGDLLRRIQDCWASAYGQRVLAYRRAQKMDEEPAIAVVVQEMVAADRSGVLFTEDPASGNPERMVVEAALGLGEVIVGGQVKPDFYRLDKSNGDVIEHRQGAQAYKIVRGMDGKEQHVQVSDFEAQKPVLNREDLKRLTETGKKVEEIFGCPQDLEWAIEKERLFVVQSRPITTLGAHKNQKRAGVQAYPSPHGSVVEIGETTEMREVKGQGASPGRRRGQVRVLTALTDLPALQKGEVLVAPMTSPDWVAAMQRAAAIVTDAGGITCHAAIVSRELQIPCVVGTQNATSELHTGDWVWVDGTLGLVSRTDSPGADAREDESAAEVVTGALGMTPEWSAGTGTQVMLNVGMPTQLEAAAHLPADGVGLLRAEFLYLNALEGRHPAEWLANQRREALIERLQRSIRSFAAAFFPRPVLYRTYDFRSNEFRGLSFGEKYERHENNPMIGFRGYFRYVEDPSLFQAELEALARVRSDFRNLHVMLPFVRTAWELERCLKIIDDSPLVHPRGLELWLMAEVPSVYHWLPTYKELGVKGISIGSNDLTQLMLGVDRDSDACAELFDEEDEAVLQMVEMLVRRGKELGLRTSICGQAPSHSRRYLERLVRVGIDSISVSPDAYWRCVAALRAEEQRLILEKCRARSIS